MLIKFLILAISTFIITSASCMNDSLRRDPESSEKKATDEKGNESQFRELTSAEKRVIVNKGTERPFTGKYNDFYKEGTYHCKRCNAALYKSDSKFNSQCGWPSFDDEIEGAVKRVIDADGIRTEIQCANCCAHLGHVFEGEGFTVKDVRHCVNSISLVFVPDQKTPEPK